MCIEEKIEGSEVLSIQFIKYLVAQCPLGNSRIHGIEHWGNVLSNGRMLSKKTGANLRVVELFAVIHDARRVNDDHDPAHGRRAAKLAESCNGTWFNIADDEMEDLYEACFYHADGLTKHNVTVMTCWDADRLDLGRVWIRPKPQYLCTKTAQKLFSSG